jgi:hypothetical protein
MTGGEMSVDIDRVEPCATVEARRMRRIVATMVSAVVASSAVAVADADALVGASRLRDPAAVDSRVGEETQVPGVEDLSYEVLESSPGCVRLVVIDRSGRNLTGRKALMVARQPTVAERRYPVQVNFPVDSDGRPLPGPTPAGVFGGYRRGLEIGRTCAEGAVSQIDIDVGFYFAESGSPNFFDTVNMPGDVSRALDVVMSAPERFGAIDPDHLLYGGGSLGGIVGFLFVHPLLRDERITAMKLSNAATQFWLPAFARKKVWQQAPPILMENVTGDDTVTYELARRTYRLARTSKRVTLMTTIGGSHDTGPGGVPCPPREDYVRAWLGFHFGSGPRPSSGLREAVQSSNCARLGLVAGGRTDFGAFTPFIPPGVRAAGPAGRAGDEVPVPGVDDLSYRVLTRTSERVRIMLIDRSGRAFDGGPDFPSTSQAPYVEVREYPVEIVWPSGAGGLVVDKAYPLLIKGEYRRGEQVSGGCSGASDIVAMCVGFYFADYDTGPDPADSPNMAGDVSRALDAVLSSPKVFGAINRRHIVYTGYSLGGIVGFNLAHPKLRDSRITAMSVGGASALMWMPAFQKRSSWRGAPPIFMRHGTRDPIITYEQAVRTFRAARRVMDITLVSQLGGPHGDGDSPCLPLIRYRGAWELWKLGLKTKPRVERREVTSSQCARVGVAKDPEATTGYGAATPFVPVEYR